MPVLYLLLDTEIKPCSEGCSSSCPISNVSRPLFRMADDRFANIYSCFRSTIIFYLNTAREFFARILTRYFHENFQTKSTLDHVLRIMNLPKTFRNSAVLRELNYPEIPILVDIVFSACKSE